MEPTSLDNILSDTQNPAPDAPEPKQEAAHEQEVPRGTITEPTPEPVKEPAKVDAPAQEMTEKERAFLAKANDEKQKRQELERKIAEMEAKLNAKPKEEPKQFWEDPESVLNTYKQEMERMVVNTKLNTSEQIARSKYQDFDEKVEIFKEVLAKTPWIFDEAKNSPDPAEFVYKTAKNYHELQQAGNMEEFRSKVEKDIRTKIEAEYRAKEEAKKKEMDAIPESLSNVRSTGTNKVVWSGPTPLDDILH